MQKKYYHILNAQRDTQRLICSLFILLVGTIVPLSHAEDIIDFDANYFGPFHMESIHLVYNPDTELYEGTTHIMFPYFNDTNNTSSYGLFIFDGKLKYSKPKNWFTYIDLSAKGVNSPIGTTGAVLYALSGAYEYEIPKPPSNPCGGKTPCLYMINPFTPPTYIITGEADISAGPGIPVGVGETIHPLAIENTITIRDLSSFIVQGKALAYGYETGDDGELVYQDGKLTFTGHVNYKPFFDTVTTMTFNSIDDISGNAKGTLHTPDLPVIGKKDIGDAQADVNVHGFTGQVDVPAPGIPKEICPNKLVPNCWNACAPIVGCHKVCGPDISVPGPCVPNPAYYTIPVKFQLYDGVFSFPTKAEQRSNGLEFSNQNVFALDEDSCAASYMTNWYTVATSSTQSGEHPLSVTPTGEAVTTLTVDEGLPGVIFRIAFTSESASNVSATLTLPDGTVLNLEDGLEREFESVQGFSLWNPEGKDASFFLYAPAGGSYTVTVNNGDELGDFVVEALAQNHVPRVEIESIVSTNEANVFEVRWTDFDPDDNADIRFYLDNDRKGNDGRLIASVEEDHPDNVLLLDVNDLNMRPGNYFLMVKVDDGVNAPVGVYSRTPIHVTNPNAPQPVTGLAVREGDGAFEIAWAPLDDPSIASYEVVYARIDDPETFHSAGSVTPDENYKTVSGMVNGYPILVSVKAVNQNGMSSELVQILRVVTKSESGRTHPVIVSEPETKAYVGESYFYFPHFFDADMHHFMDSAPEGEEEIDDPYTWTLLTGPEGMELAEGRYLLWTPTAEQTGAHQVAIKINDRYAQEGPDAESEWTVQEFTVFVHDFASAPAKDNHPFRFLSYPTITAFEGNMYTYEIYTNAPDDSIQYELIFGPEGMTVSEDGLLEWNVPLSAKGEKVLLLATVDGQYEIEQEFFLHTVTAENTLNPSAFKNWRELN